jgi:hypothetical protein
MKKTCLALALLITGFLVTGNAYGEDEVYYCAETSKNGFSYDRKQSLYKPASVTPSKFKLQLDIKSKQIELVFASQIRELYSCTSAALLNGRPEGIISCVSG